MDGSTDTIQALVPREVFRTRFTTIDRSRGRDRVFGSQQYAPLCEVEGP
jgi:hypothetical protein